MERTERKAIVLPCRIGDRVWAIRNYKGTKRATEGIVSEMFYTANMELCIVVKSVARGKWDTSGKGYYSQANRAKLPQQKWNTVCANRAESKGNVWIGNNTIRLITMAELEKLQTLPVGYTACLTNKEKRGKGIGNGWTVDVIAHIFRGLQPEKVITWYERIKAMPIDEMASFLTYLKTRGVLETADRYICQKCKEEHGGRCSIGDDDKCLYDMGDKDTIKLWLEGDAYKWVQNT